MAEDGELFAGPGGWGVAELLLGIRTKGLEWDAAAVATAAAAGLIRLVDSAGKGLDVAASDPLTVFPNGLRLLVGSPPCQAFSAAGKGKGRAGAAYILMGVDLIAWGNDPVQVCKWVDEKLDDPRAALVLEPLRWAKDLLPEYIALEQVPTVLPLWEAMAEVLRSWGYSVWCGNLQAEQYDVPQTRKRAILIASRVREVSCPPPVRRKYRKGTPQHEIHKLDAEGLRPWISMSQALGWGGTARLGYTVLAGGTDTGGAEPFGNGARQQMVKAQDRGEWSLRSNYNGPPTQDGSPRERTRRALEEPSVALTSKPGHWEPGHREPQVMGDVRQANGGNHRWQMATAGATARYTSGQVPRDADEPTATITGKGTAYWTDPEPLPERVTPDSVRVTVQEAATLQGFPPDYPWQGNKSAQYRQVGDAMPPPLAWHVLRALFGLPVQHYPGTEHL